MHRTRRTLLVGGVVVAAAAASRVLSTHIARPQSEGGRVCEPPGKVFVKGDVRIHYQDLGRGFPLLVIAGGGLNSRMTNLAQPFDPRVEFMDEYRCIATDLRNANGGDSSGPLEVDRPWDSYTDDHLDLMDHLKIDRFGVIGFCIGGPFIWNLIRRARNRVVAAVAVQPSGFSPDMPTLYYDNAMAGWGPQLVGRRPDITLEMVDRFATRMFRTNADFLFTVSRDFVRSCQTPVLVLPDDIPAHPYSVAMETVMLEPKAEVSIFPWKDPPNRIPIAVRQVRSFLQAHIRTTS